MPRTQQIVPQNSYPHEEVYINDNSAQSLDELASNTVVYPYICVFAGPKGIDNKLVNIDSLSTYHAMFGQTNFKKYGQPHLMPEAILSQENTTVWAMRVMPDDALYANSILSLWYKEDEENKAFRIKFTVKHMGLDYDTELGEEGMKEVLANRDDIIELANRFDGAAVGGAYTDSEGYTQVPLAVFTAIGRGVYGQNLRWRIVSNTDYEKEYGVKTYTFEAIDVENGATIVAKQIATIVSTSKLSSTVFINDIIEDTDTENLAIHIHFFEENVENLYAAYKAFCLKMIAADPSLDITIPDIDEFDPFFGKACKQQTVRVTPNEPFIKFTEKLTDDVNKEASDYVEANFTSSDIISVDDVAGNVLMNGSDGAFANTDVEKRQKAIDDCYIKAFSGELDKLILAPRRIKSTALFDANYSMDVKIALARLALYRASSIVYLDTGIRESLGVTDIKTMEVNYAPLDDLVDEFENFSENWIVSVNAHDYVIKESSTGKRVPVTITYWLASTDATHTQNHDTITPHTNSNAMLSGHVKNSLKPAIEENETDLKEALYQARINYFEAVGENQFERATQSCYVHGNSDLLEESNVKALLAWKEILTEEARKNRNRITSPTMRQDFRNELLDKYSYLQGTCFETMDIQYRSNEYESKRNIVHMYTAVTFPAIAKITLVEIDVNQRAYQADLEDE